MLRFKIVLSAIFFCLPFSFSWCFLFYFFLPVFFSFMMLYFVLFFQNSSFLLMAIEDLNVSFLFFITNQNTSLIFLLFCFSLRGVIVDLLNSFTFLFSVLYPHLLHSIPSFSFFFSRRRPQISRSRLFDRNMRENRHIGEYKEEQKLPLGKFPSKKFWVGFRNDKREKGFRRSLSFLNHNLLRK